jgi:hypothetical protein
MPRRSSIKSHTSDNFWVRERHTQADNSSTTTVQHSMRSSWLPYSMFPSKMSRVSGLFFSKTFPQRATSSSTLFSSESSPLFVCLPLFFPASLVSHDDRRSDSRDASFKSQSPIRFLKGIIWGKSFLLWRPLWFPYFWGCCPWPTNSLSLFFPNVVTIFDNKFLEL